MIWPNKPKLDARNAEDVRLYSTDDLRHLYHAEKSNLIPLRDGIITREEIRAVILWRVWWMRSRYFLLLLVSIIGAFAAVIAAIEG
jgi:hypothetical protein